jgi:hypothetical protein
LAPDFRASLMPIAIACLRLFTFRFPPDFSLPLLYSRMTLPTLLCAFRLYFRPRPLELVLEEALVRFDLFLGEVERDVPRRVDLLSDRLAVELLRLLVVVRPPCALLERRRVELDFLAVAIRI